NLGSFRPPPLTSGLPGSAEPDAHNLLKLLALAAMGAGERAGSVSCSKWYDTHPHQILICCGGAAVRRTGPSALLTATNPEAVVVIGRRVDADARVATLTGAARK